MKGKLTEQDIFYELEKCIKHAGLDWSEFISVATDAPAMWSENVGSTGHLKEKLKSLGVSISVIRCILHKRVLWENIADWKPNRHGCENNQFYAVHFKLQHFSSFLSIMNNEYGELLYHSEVRWYSWGIF